ncbi:nucleotidyltransferase domain-containing protein [Synechococcales cyanobacterium C]|uniref:Nucleotidyltransferase domain-containing protein n=1 Tax=Petrachloros mirabilis ULC683 TaxID=2781853 RepID=A0A8K2A0V5_9CYAN|nr:nucleotidyltransferase domain-containing protein [Petrachloros mirabilis]NCJ07722.1 nucleotidyltransferase domain-containing protein [Petrachloros mirabilis ULC683]
MSFNTDILDAALGRRRQEHEQQRLMALEGTIQWLETQGGQYGINRAYLFGSVLWPYRFIPRSDVDVAVEQIKPESFFVALAALSEALERDIDLVELSRCHFADRIRQQGMLWKRKI